MSTKRKSVIGTIEKNLVASKITESNIPIVINIATVEQINKKISIIFSTFSLARKFFSIFRKTIRAVIKKTNKDKKKIKFLDTENSGYK